MALKSVSIAGCFALSISLLGIAPAFAETVAGVVSPDKRLIVELDLNA